MIFQTETKAFYLTSEFWLTIATLLATFTDLVPTRYKGVVAAVVTAAYAIARGLAKQGVPAGAVADPATVPPDGVDKPPAQVVKVAAKKKP